MPIYEYECKDCKNHFELIQKMSDPSTGICPHCHGIHVERLVSAAGFQLKGSGWYATDFKNSCKTPEKSPCASCPADPKGKSE